MGSLAQKTMGGIPTCMREGFTTPHRKNSLVKKLHTGTLIL